MGRKKYFSSLKKKQRNKVVRQYKCYPGLKCSNTQIIIPTNKIKLSFQLLQHHTSLPQGWSSLHHDDSIVLCYLEWNNTFNPIIKFTVNIAKDLQYSISVYDHQKVTLQQQITIHNTSDVLHLLQYLTQLNICQANNDDKYVQLAKDHIFTDTQGNYNFST